MQVVKDVTNELDNEIKKEEIVDLEDNRREGDKLVRREVKALYENGYFIGKIKYFNKKVSKYVVSLNDGTDDDIDITEIDDVKVILLQKMFDACENVHFLFSFFFCSQFLFDA